MEEKREYLRKCNGGGGGISKYMLSMCYLCSLISVVVVNQESTVGQNEGYCQNEGMSVNYLLVSPGNSGIDFNIFFVDSPLNISILLDFRLDSSRCLRVLQCWYILDSQCILIQLMYFLVHGEKYSLYYIELHLWISL